MKELSARQREVLEFIYSFAEEYGRSPTGPEIARQFLLKSVTGGYQYVQSLVDKGYLARADTGARPIPLRMTPKTYELFSPRWHVVNDITAGPAVAGEQGEDRYVSEITDLLPMIRAGDFFFVVRGDSMLHDGIEAGHTVVIRPDIRPRQGDICAVWIPGSGGTLKRVYRDGEMVRLVSSNPHYETLVYKEQEIVIKGVLVASMAVNSFV